MDLKQAGAVGFGTVGIVGMAVMGAVKIITPTEIECREDRASLQAHNERLEAAVGACEDALDDCAASWDGDR